MWTDIPQITLSFSRLKEPWEFKALMLESYYLNFTTPTTNVSSEVME